MATESTCWKAVVTRLDEVFRIPRTEQEDTVEAVEDNELDIPPQSESYEM